MSLRILIHSYRMIANNIPDVIRIALIPWLATVMLISFSYIVWFGTMFPDPESLVPDTSGGSLLISLIFVMLIICIYLWIIVGWHRFVLLGEAPDRFSPNWHGANNLSYFLSSLMIGLALIIPMIICGMIISSIGLSGGYTVFLVMGFAFNLFVLFIGTRISLVLPAAAIGVPMKISESWQATEGENMAIFKLALMLATISSVVGLFTNAIALNTVGILLGQFFNGLLGLYSVSIITTLYGVLIEKRDL